MAHTLPEKLRPPSASSRVHASCASRDREGKQEACSPHSAGAAGGTAPSSVSWEVFGALRVCGRLSRIREFGGSGPPPRASHGAQELARIVSSRSQLFSRALCGRACGEEFRGALGHVLSPTPLQTAGALLFPQDSLPGFRGVSGSGAQRSRKGLEETP